jgi:hypothetical protein
MRATVSPAVLVLLTTSLKFAMDDGVRELKHGRDARSVKHTLKIAD